MRLLILAILALAFSGGALAADLEKGKEYYAVCIACHGPDAKGNKALNAPNLTGLQEWYMVRQLQNFKSGLRGGNPTEDMIGAQMRPMSMTLPDEQAMKDVWAYIQTLNASE